MEKPSPLIVATIFICMVAFANQGEDSFCKKPDSVGSMGCSCSDRTEQKSTDPDCDELLVNKLLQLSIKLKILINLGIGTKEQQANLQRSLTACKNMIINYQTHQDFKQEKAEQFLHNVLEFIQGFETTSDLDSPPSRPYVRQQ